MKRVVFVILTLVFCLSAYSTPRGRGGDARQRFTLVLDAGHGGSDPGCVGSRTKEKDVNLAVIRLIGEKVQAEMADSVEVVYTRSTDTFVKLRERAAIANRAGGDLFISVHVNSLPPRSPRRNTVQGAMVLICGLDDTNRNLEVAMRENSVMELESDYSTSYHGFDPNSSESYIIFELTQNRHQAQSLDFATMALDHLITDAGRANMDVRQQGVWVLWATSMPSALIELDFMCNPEQERFLGSAEGQEKCAEAIYQAFRDYFHKMNR